MQTAILITGAAGFVGQHLCAFLVQQGESLSVAGADVCRPQREAFHEFFVVDISDSKAIDDVICSVDPDIVVHLAASFGDPDTQETYRINVMSTLGLLESLRVRKPEAIVLTTGSAAEYGLPSQLPVREDTPCRPLLSYGLSKLFATELALYYHRVFHMNTMVVRPFQLIGPGVSERLAPGAFAAQIESVKNGNADVITVGNLEAARDFLDVDDAVRAIWALCKKPFPGHVFNLCSGTPTRVSDLLQQMMDIANVHGKIRIDTQKGNKGVNVPEIYGSFEKLREHSNWEPTTSLSESIMKMFGV